MAGSQNSDVLKENVQPRLTETKFNGQNVGIMNASKPVAPPLVSNENVQALPADKNLEALAISKQQQQQQLLQHQQMLQQQPEASSKNRRKKKAPIKHGEQSLQPVVNPGLNPGLVQDVTKSEIQIGTQSDGNQHVEQKIQENQQLSKVNF